jgi:PKD repeat protein
MTCTHARAAFLALAPIVTLPLLSCSGGGGGGRHGEQSLELEAQFVLDVLAGIAPLTVNFDASGSLDGGGTIASFEWDFDDDGTVDLTSAQPEAQFVYRSGGKFKVTLRVVDGDGASSTLSRTVTVKEVEVVVGEVDAESEISGEALAIAEVGGNPAVVYTGDGAMRFARALDAAGSSWDAAVDVVPSGASDVALLTLGGKPAVIYLSQGSALLRVSANDEKGGTWSGLALVIAQAPQGFSFTAAFHLVADGLPAVILRQSDGAGAQLLLTRALDADGFTWRNPPVEITPAGHILSRPTALIANGRPCVGFQSGGLIWFKQATDTLGESWPAAPVIAADPGDIDGDLVSAEVGGRPAIAYEGQGGLFMVQALDAQGSSWGELRLLVSDQVTRLDHPRLAVIGGAPMFMVDNLDTGAVELLIGSDAQGSLFPTQLVLHAGRSQVGALASIKDQPAAALRAVAGGPLEFVLVR